MRDAVLVHVRGVDDGLRGQQVARRDYLGVVLIALEAAGTLAVIQVLEQRLEHVRLVHELLVALRGLERLVDAALDHLHVGHDEFEVDDIDVALRVGAALNVDDVLVVKTAHDVDYRVGGTDVAEELVAEPLALGRALDKARDVNEFDDGGGVLLGLVQLCEEVQPLVRHGHHADVRLDRAEREVCRRRARVRDGVEEG